MVASGEGVTLLPELAHEIEAAEGSLALVPFAKPSPARTIGLAGRVRRAPTTFARWQT